MRGARIAGALAATLAAWPAVAQGPAPSGQALVLWEVLWERVDGADAPQAVLRFIAPQIARDGGDVDADAATADIGWLCDTHGLPIATLPYAPTGSVVITLMDRPVGRGQTDPEATQYFGLFSIEDGLCVPEDY